MAKNKGHQTEEGISFIFDDEHYTEVFKRMTDVKDCLRIATGNVKNFYVTIEKNGEEKKLRLCDFFLSLVERGVQVQVVCMKPWNFYNYTKEKCPQLLENPLFGLRCNEHNHMKLFVFDDECAYIGSANITDAAIGKRPVKIRNHEAGMLVWEEKMIEILMSQFGRAWDNPCILKHTWKRFTKKAKEWKRESFD